MSRKSKIYLLIMSVVLVAIIAATSYYICLLQAFNNTERTISYQEEGDVSFVIGPRFGESWLKRDVVIDDTLCTLTGTTFDLTFTNATDYTVDDWKIRIDIGCQCFVNQNWCGSLEIHQFRNDVETTQTLALKSDMSAMLDSIKLDYYMLGQDLLIRLEEGDYLVYIPDSATELPVNPAGNEPSTVTCGIIFYYLTNSPVETATANYTFNRTFMQGDAANYLIAAMIIWGIGAIAGIIVFVSYSVIKKHLELKLSGMSAMNGLFDYIFTVDLKTCNTFMVSSIEDTSEAGSEEYDIFERIITDTEPLYKETLLEFLNLDTVENRLITNDSLVYEFKSSEKGWCSIRFLPLERNRVGQLEKVLFTVRLINDEHEQLEKSKKNIEEIAKENAFKNEYLVTTSNQLTEVAKNITAGSSHLLTENLSEENKVTVHNIITGANIIDATLNLTRDYVEALDGTLHDISCNYTIKQLVVELEELVFPFKAKKAFEFKTDVLADDLQTLKGDYLRIKAVLLNLYKYIIMRSDNATITLGVYGKADGDTIHLLYSLKIIGTCPSISEDATEFKVGNKVLEIMGSSLKTVSVDGNLSDIHFSLDQKVVR